MTATDHRDGAAVAQFVEEVGFYFESFGLPRMVGRIMGHLLVCDPPHQSAAELMAALSVSSGSISTTARSLIQMGFVERVAVPGDRRSFYRLRSDAWTAAIDAREAEMRRLRELAERGLAALADAPAERRGRLDDMRHLAAFIEAEFPALVTRFHQQRP
jgi:DNA-binding transcriptional regulator GbsR (MarR family)